MQEQEIIHSIVKPKSADANVHRNGTLHDDAKGAYGYNDYFLRNLKEVSTRLSRPLPSISCNCQVHDASLDSNKYLDYVENVTEKMTYLRPFELPWKVQVPKDSARLKDTCQRRQPCKNFRCITRGPLIPYTPTLFHPSKQHRA